MLFFADVSGHYRVLHGDSSSVCCTASEAQKARRLQPYPRLFSSVGVQEKQ